MFFYLKNKVFRNNYKGLACTADTARNLAEMTYLNPNTFLCLYGIPEVFNVVDFCELIKKCVFESIKLGFANNTSVNYQRNFKAVSNDIKESWASEASFPEVTVSYNLN